MATFKRIGALWRKSAKGADKKDFLSGTIDLGVLGEVNIMVFENEKPEKNQPHYTIHVPIEEKEKGK
jgi:hypothetical protein